MVSAISSDWVLWLAFVIGCLLLLLTVTLFAMVFVLRLSLVKTQDRQRVFTEAWAPVWNACFSNDLPEDIPNLEEQDVTTFLVQWIQYQETYEDSMREVLNLVALKAGLENHLLTILKRKSVREKILAITAFGFLKDKSYWSMLFQLALSESTFISMAAARALLHLDPKKALPLLINRIQTRGDWPQARVMLFLAESGIDIISEPLAMAVQQSPSKTVATLIPYLEIINSSLALSTLECVLLRTKENNKDVLLACLNTMGKFMPREEQISIRVFLTHPEWEIRAAAIRALSKVANPDDEDRLIALLLDTQHIVQYEAAKALFRLPQFTPEHSIEVQEKLMAEPDTLLGGLILTRVMTEKELKPI